MHTYAVDLTNPDDVPVGLSFTSGRYGFTVRAASMDAAIEAVRRRARDDGFAGFDWQAQVTRLVPGQGVRWSWKPFDRESQRIVSLT